MISEEHKVRSGPEGQNELDDVLDQLEGESPSSPRHENKISENKLPKLGSGDSKKIPSLGLGEQRPPVITEPKQTSENKPKQKNAGMFKTLKTFFSKPMPT